MKRLDSDACLVAASAAALTVGRFTLPVYEIYKVGQDQHWVEGINVLGRFGFDLVVIPHWNNAEGGTHDTRFCYMGEPRFRRLESLLPDDVSIFGLDEHTACLLDLEKEEAVIKGIGRVTLRRRGAEMVFEKGDRFSFEVLRGGEFGEGWKRATPESTHSEPASDTTKESFWDRIHAIQAAFHAGLEKHDPKETTTALLELDRTIWEAQQDLENEEFISQARDTLREMIVRLGMGLQSSSENGVDCLASLVDGLLDLRDSFRQNKQWKEADAIRKAMKHAKIAVEDTKKGPLWRVDAGKKKSEVRSQESE
jgi:hypothetical protein